MRRNIRSLAAPALCLGLISLAACNGNDRPAVAPPVPVLVDTVKVQDVPLEVRSIGSVEAYNTVSVKARVGGEIKKVYFEEGQDVRRGDMLFLIDPAPYQAALESARADLARDSAAWLNARETVKRYSELVRKEYITAQQFDDMQAQERQLAASVMAARADLDNAKLNLDFCSVRSPLDGRTGMRMVDQGNVIKANEGELVVINQVRPIYVTFTIAERYLTEIRAQDGADGELRVLVNIPDDGEKLHEGRLSFLDNMVDEATGTLRLKAVFDNQDLALWPGQFVDTRLVLKILHGVVTAPSQAVQPGQNGSFVYVVKPDMSVESRPVAVSYDSDNLTVFDSGLQPSEVVVTDGQLRLRPGSTVQFKSGLSASAPDSAAGGGVQ
ncbi:efflux RND transporter periplasmic adaptor subunit [bacterium]|nr:efflux RND transporter periplasmic adaptor subunit [bacterium]